MQTDAGKRILEGHGHFIFPSLAVHGCFGASGQVNTFFFLAVALLSDKPVQKATLKHHSNIPANHFLPMPSTAPLRSATPGIKLIDNSFTKAFPFP
jgi:hypothetical protein